MKILNVTFFIILLLTFFLFFRNSPETPPNELLEKDSFQNLHNKTFEITNNFEYTNLYQQEPTIKNVAFNIVNGFLYNLLVQINTMIPVVAYAASHTDFMTKWIIIGVTLLIITLIVKSIIPIIGIYFFIKEKKKYKEKITD